MLQKGLNDSAADNESTNDVTQHIKAEASLFNERDVSGNADLDSFIGGNADQSTDQSSSGYSTGDDVTRVKGEPEVAESGEAGYALPEEERDQCSKCGKMFQTREQFR